MIRSETEYKEAVARLNDEKRRLKVHRERLEKSGLTSDEIKRVIDPIESFYQQLQEEVSSYEGLKRGEFVQLENFSGLGNLLIALRISQNLSQRELAKRLNVHETQVSRDERNEYFGVTVDRAMKILDALGARLITHVESSQTDFKSRQESVGA